MPECHTSRTTRYWLRRLDAVFQGSNPYEWPPRLFMLYEKIDKEITSRYKLSDKRDLDLPEIEAMIEDLRHKFAVEKLKVDKAHVYELLKSK
jgi:hypothetical protein